MPAIRNWLSQIINDGNGFVLLICGAFLALMVIIGVIWSFKKLKWIFGIILLLVVAIVLIWVFFGR